MQNKNALTVRYGNKLCPLFTRSNLLQLLSSCLFSYHYRPVPVALPFSELESWLFEHEVAFLALFWEASHMLQLAGHQRGAHCQEKSSVSYLYHHAICFLEAYAKQLFG
uniref:Uncharacterized protein n=1 Tax=Populus davidiana TaxID=266767 RepID=A0A6M2EZ56_9ROSI